MHNFSLSNKDDLNYSSREGEFLFLTKTITVIKAVNQEDKRSRRHRDRDFAKFERSRRYRER